MNVLNRLFNTSTFSKKIKANSLVFFFQKNETLFTLINYLVITRVCSEPKFHKIYQNFISKWGKIFKNFYNLVLKKSIEIGLIFLRKRINNISTPEWRILKTLGKWIGSLTMVKDRPLWFRFISITHFLFRAYDQGTLLYTLPLFSSLFHSSLKSKIFKTRIPWIEEIVELFFEISNLIFIRPAIHLDLKLLLKKLFNGDSWKTLVFFFFSSEKEQSATLLDQKVIKKFSLKNISRRKFLENDRFFNFLKIKTQKSGNWRDRVKKLDFKRHFLSLYKTNLRLFGNKGGEFDFFKKIQSGLKNLNQKNFKIELSLCKKIRSEQRILNFFSGLFVRGINKLNQHKTHPLFDFLLEYSRFTFFKSFFFNYFVDENFSTKLFFKRLLELYLMNFWNSIFNNFLSSSPFRSSLYTFKLNFKFHDSLKKKNGISFKILLYFPYFF